MSVAAKCIQESLFSNCAYVNARVDLTGKVITKGTKPRKLTLSNLTPQGSQILLAIRRKAHARILPYMTLFSALEIDQ